MKQTFFNINPEVQRALDFGALLVALESTVTTHGLPQPMNCQRSIPLLWNLA